MGANNKTEHLKLPQWEGNEYFERLDMNDAFRAIEDGLVNFDWLAQTYGVEVSGRADEYSEDIEAIPNATGVTRRVFKLVGDGSDGIGNNYIKEILLMDGENVGEKQYPLVIGDGEVIGFHKLGDSAVFLAAFFMNFLSSKKLKEQLTEKFNGDLDGWWEWLYDRHNYEFKEGTVSGGYHQYTETLVDQGKNKVASRVTTERDSESSSIELYEEVTTIGGVTKTRLININKVNGSVTEYLSINGGL